MNLQEESSVCGQEVTVEPVSPLVHFRCISFGSVLSGSKVLRRILWGLVVSHSQSFVLKSLSSMFSRGSYSRTVLSLVVALQDIWIHYSSGEITAEFTCVIFLLYVPTSLLVFLNKATWLTFSTCPEQLSAVFKRTKC